MQVMGSGNSRRIFKNLMGRVSDMGGANITNLAFGGSTMFLTRKDQQCVEVWQSSSREFWWVCCFLSYFISKNWRRWQRWLVWLHVVNDPWLVCTFLIFGEVPTTTMLTIFHIIFSFCLTKCFNFFLLRYQIYHPAKSGWLV